MVNVMDAFNQTAERLARSMPYDQIDDDKRPFCEVGNWVALHPNRQYRTFGSHFQSLAVFYDVTYYIEARASTSCLVQILAETCITPVRIKHTLHSLLKDAIFRGRLVSVYGRERPNPQTIAFMVRRGARFWLDPNSAPGLRDPIIDLVEYIRERVQRNDRREELQTWLSILEIFTQHHDTIWLANETRSLDSKQRAANRILIRKLIESFSPSWELQRRYSIFETLGSSLSLSQSSLRQDRLDLLRTVAYFLRQTLDRSRAFMISHSRAV